MDNIAAAIVAIGFGALALIGWHIGAPSEWLLVAIMVAMLAAFKAT